MSEDSNGTASSPHPSFAHYADRQEVASRLRASGAPEGRLVSNSEVQTFLRCRRKWWLAWYQGMRPKLESPVGVRSIGDRVHQCLAGWYVPDGVPRVEPQETLERLIEEDLARVQAYYKTRDEEVPPGLLIDLNKDANLMRAMLEGYMQWVAETGVDADLIIVSSETYMEARFPVPTEQLPVFIIGKLDVKALRTTDRVRLFMDHKTVAAFAQKTRTVHMSPQMLHYHLLEWLNGTDTEERCDGALYNMIRRVKRSVTAKPPFYQRFPVMHNAHEIESYRKRLIGTITDILHVERALGDGYDHKYVAYSRPTEDCTWDCDFFLLCHRFDDGSRAEAMLADYFVRGDPLSYYAPNEKGGS